ncbi:ABC transporter ATP-binding protein [Ectothiorhodospiraceae bacterium 2226]|nr:ABC transporter ATP-binding protein [Ectothiorhodospiraceae bacterium 2226]
MQRAIQVRGVSKLYRIGTRDQMNESLGAAAIDFLRSPLKNYRKYRSLYRFDDVDMAADEGGRNDILWSLRDVSFDVDQGEVVGIIGRNGAGKSTLLKILSRITPPTLGELEIRGRISSLLEVGTGFHPELTGRENVYLNGTILGMTKREVDRKFDEIAAFAAIDRFLDTPVKRYSSGMKVRLAFAVAAHLEPEILIIDEVLAVGDAAFQRKCLNKMQEVGQEGRTVLFVSHNVPAVSRLCSRVIMLDQGRLLHDGPTGEVISRYVNAGMGTMAVREWAENEAPGSDLGHLRAVRIRDESGQIAGSVDIRRPITVEMEYELHESGHHVLPNFHFFNADGIQLFSAHDVDPAWRGRPRPAGRYVSSALIPGNLLAEGTVFINVAVVTLDPVVKVFHEREVTAFQVIDSIDGDSARGEWTGDMKGVMRPMLKWTTRYTPSEELPLRRVAGSED